MRELLLFCFGLITFLSSCQEKAGGEKEDTISDSVMTHEFGLEIIIKDVMSPVGIESAGDGSGRLFIVSQNGKIHIVKDGELVPEPFLDITSNMVKLNNTYAERGLLGLAFHPNYKENGRFFIYYSAKPDIDNNNNKSVIEEYKVNSENPNQAIPNGKEILSYEEPENNHNGGSLAFGPDGYLYIGSGDGGGAGDEHGKYGNAQNLENLLGKILRIDVDSGEPYSIPEDNPFQKDKQRPEIYAYGIRNPWRMSFDKVSGNLFVADVGQNKYEEIDIVEKGKNYGWRYMEGYHVFDEGLEGMVKNSEMPIHEYDHEQGISITGGYVYSGTKIKDLYGAYIFADWEGATWYLQKDEIGKWTSFELKLRNKPKDWYINSFGQDENGEIYLATQPNIGAVSKTGVIYKLVK